MEFLKKYLNYIWSTGGKFVQTNIKNLEQINSNETVIRSENEEYKFEKTVVASGAFSKSLTDQLGENIPLDTERGLSCSF
jgi:D-amino-acid dehydrogenase